MGSEGELGLIQGIGGLITAVIVYVLGRVTKPKDRIVVFAVGIVIFFIGTLVNAALFSAVGVIVFVLCKIFFQPLHDLAYNPNTAPDDRRGVASGAPQRIRLHHEP